MAKKLDWEKERRASRARAHGHESATNDQPPSQTRFEDYASGMREVVRDYGRLDEFQKLNRCSECEQRLTAAFQKALASARREKPEHLEDLKELHRQLANRIRGQRDALSRKHQTGARNPGAAAPPVHLRRYDGLDLLQRNLETTMGLDAARRLIERLRHQAKG